MTRLKLTSPGVLLIVATALTGGILLLDGFYLRPYVTAQKECALREQAVRTERTVRHAIRSEQNALAAVCAGLAGSPEARGFFEAGTTEEDFRTFARRSLSESGTTMAWLTDPAGRIAAVWSRPESSRAIGGPQAWKEATADALAEMGSPQVRSDGGLIRLSATTAVFARRHVPGDGDGSHPVGSLWLVRAIDAGLLGRIGQDIGGEVTTVNADALPETALAEAAASRAVWLVGADTLAVAWLASDPAGRTLGYFRAQIPVVQIHGQALVARRIVLIVLSLSVGLVVLVIMGIHMLITGPVVRLLKRLQQLDTGQGKPGNLTRDLHGEPLVLARRLESAFERLAHISKTDQLTGLANRRHFEEVLALFYHQSRRYNRPLSLAVIDVDFLKAINDTGGHQAGDDLLKVVAAAIEDACRRADLPARFGGDEFAILLPETLAADAEKVAARVRGAVAGTSIVAKSLALNVTVSIGIADLNSGEIAGPEAMISLADQALYAAKELGRNRIILAHDVGGTNLDPEAKEKQEVDVLCKKLAGLDSQFKGVFLQAVEEVVKVLEQRDSNMADHARKVRHYAVLIAREMELPDRVVKRIEVASMLHDIGMLALPDSVILCPKELGPAELANMRRHPLLSVRIMERMEFLEQEIPAVRYHHERYDGKGYPEGIAGAAIPLTARIVAVADTFDALTSDRTFRKAMTPSRAIAEIQRVAGTQLDPTVVGAFCAVAARLGEALTDISGLRGESRWRETKEPVPAETR